MKSSFCLQKMSWKRRPSQKYVITDCGTSIWLIYHSLISFTAMKVIIFCKPRCPISSNGQYVISRFKSVHIYSCLLCKFILLRPLLGVKSLPHTVNVPARLNVCYFLCGIVKTGASSTTICLPTLKPALSIRMACLCPVHLEWCTGLKRVTTTQPLPASATTQGEVFEPVYKLELGQMPKCIFFCYVSSYVNKFSH